MVLNVCFVSTAGKQLVSFVVKGVLIVLKSVLKTHVSVFSNSLLSDESLMDSYTLAAASLRVAIYLLCALDDLVAG